MDRQKIESAIDALIALLVRFGGWLRNDVDDTANHRWQVLGLTTVDSHDASYLVQINFSCYRFC